MTIISSMKTFALWESAGGHVFSDCFQEVLMSEASKVLSNQFMMLPLNSKIEDRQLIISLVCYMHTACVFL